MSGEHQTRHAFRTPFGVRQVTLQTAGPGARLAASLALALGVVLGLVLLILLIPVILVGGLLFLGWTLARQLRRAALPSDDGRRNVRVIRRDPPP